MHTIDDTDPVTELHARERELLEERLREAAGRESVLVVDDDECVREMVADFLRMQPNREVLEAGTLQQARELMRDHPVDLVICDIRLPDGNGLALLEWCDRHARDAAFILVTGFADTENVIRALNLGAASLLEKPFDIFKLGRAVDRALAGKRAERLEEGFRSYLHQANRELRQQVADAIVEYQDLYLGAIKALAKAIDARDPYTRRHSEAVGLLAGITAEALGLPQAAIETAVLAGELHDLGKLAVPERVLLKPGALTPEEFAIVRTHPEKSREILANLPHMEQVSEAAYAHHERYDGRGYPRGLTAEAIPLPARIVAVCDAWDAMTSDRPYRRGLPRERAMAVIEREAGAQFDPLVAEAFLERIRADKTLHPSKGENEYETERVNAESPSSAFPSEGEGGNITAIRR